MDQEQLIDRYLSGEATEAERAEVRALASDDEQFLEAMYARAEWESEMCALFPDRDRAVRPDASAGDGGCEPRPTSGPHDERDQGPEWKIWLAIAAALFITVVSFAKILTSSLPDADDLWSFFEDGGQDGGDATPNRQAGLAGNGDKKKGKKASGPDDATPAPEIMELIGKLGAEEYDVREVAERTLRKMGPKVLLALKRAYAETKLPEIRTRLNWLLRVIRLDAALARLEKLSPEAGKVLSIAKPGDRQEAMLKWVKTVDRRKVAPLLVELTQCLDKGPMLWGCWETLNMFAAEASFLGMPGMAWVYFSDPPSVFDELNPLFDQKMEVELVFSEVAMRSCKQTPARDQNSTVPGRVMLANQFQPLGLGFFMGDRGKVAVLLPREGAIHWREWWARVHGNPEWAPGNLETPNARNLSNWLSVLQGDDLTAARRAVRRLVDNWNSAGVEAAIRKASSGQGQVARLAKEMLMMTSMRDAGRIVFDHEVPGGKKAVWTMRPDGSGLEALLPGDLETRNWLSIWDGRDDILLLADWDNMALHALKYGTAGPLRICKANAHSIHLLKGTNQLIYLEQERRSGGPGALRMFDLDRKTHLPLPNALAVNVESPVPSPNGTYVAFVQPKAEKNARSVMLWEIGTSKIQELLALSARHRPTGNRLSWSGDGRFVAYDSYTHPPFQGQLWVMDTKMGKKASVMGQLRACGGYTWAPAGARLFFWAQRHGEKKHDLMMHESGTPLTRIAVPEEARKGRLQWLSDGRLLIAGAKAKYLVRPDDLKGIQRLPVPGGCYLHRGVILEGAGRKWFLAGMEGIPGCFSRQIALISDDGKTILPLTNLPDGASSPQFIPSSALRRGR